MFNIANMSAAERSKLADSVAAATELMDVDQKRLFIEALSSALDTNVKAEAETNCNKTVMSKINAARADKHLGGQNELGLIDGSLRRAGIEPLDTLAQKQPHEIYSILASATKLDPRDKFAVKSFLFKVGAIPA